MITCFKHYSPYIWKLFNQDSDLHLDGGGVLQENDVSRVAEDAVQPGRAWLLKREKTDKTKLISCFWESLDAV